MIRMMTIVMIDVINELELDLKATKTIRMKSDVRCGEESLLLSSIMFHELLSTTYKTTQSVSLTYLFWPDPDTRKIRVSHDT
jgi:hypothetical protein